MTQVLAAFIAIPYGLSVLMRGSDGLNRGTYTSREAGLLAATGGALILTSLAMLMGARYVGVLTSVALLIAVALTLRRRYVDRGYLTPQDVAARGLLTGLLIALILAGM